VKSMDLLGLEVETGVPSERTRIAGARQQQIFRLREVTRKRVASFRTT